MLVSIASTITPKNDGSGTLFVWGDIAETLNNKWGLVEKHKVAQLQGLVSFQLMV